MEACETGYQSAKILTQAESANLAVLRKCNNCRNTEGKWVNAVTRNKVFDYIIIHSYETN